MITRPIDESPELREQLYLSTPNSGLPSICLKLIGFTEYPISQLLPGYAMLTNSPAIPVVYRNSPHVSSRLAVTLSVPLGSRLKEQPPCGTCSSPGVGGGKSTGAPLWLSHFCPDVAHTTPSTSYWPKPVRSLLVNGVGKNNPVARRFNLSISMHGCDMSWVCRQSAFRLTSQSRHVSFLLTLP